MKIDFHFHLEEETHSLAWLERTGLALKKNSRNHASQNERESLAWIEHITRSLSNNMNSS